MGGLISEAERQRRIAARKVARGERAESAPDCPNPSYTMFNLGATWRHDCECPSCLAGRESSARRNRGPIHVNQYVDEIAVDRAVTGDRPAHLNKAERMAATVRLGRSGLTARQIAERLGVDTRTVVRYRTELRMESE